MCARNAAESAQIDIILSSISTESGLPLPFNAKGGRYANGEALCMIDASAQLPHIGARRFFGEGGDGHFRRQISDVRRTGGQSWCEWRRRHQPARGGTSKECQNVNAAESKRRSESEPPQTRRDRCKQAEREIAPGDSGTATRCHVSRRLPSHRVGVVGRCLP